MNISLPEDLLIQRRPTVFQGLQCLLSIAVRQCHVTSWDPRIRRIPLPLLLLFLPLLLSFLKTALSGSETGSVCPFSNSNLLYSPISSLNLSIFPFILLLISIILIHNKDNLKAHYKINSWNLYPEIINPSINFNTEQKTQLLLPVGKKFSIQGCSIDKAWGDSGKEQIIETFPKFYLQYILFL